MHLFIFILRVRGLLVLLWYVKLPDSYKSLMISLLEGTECIAQDVENPPLLIYRLE